MKEKINVYFFVAGIINLFTAILHTIGGQEDLVNPLFESQLTNQVKAEWLGVWHMVTVLLFLSSVKLIYCAFRKDNLKKIELLHFLGYSYCLFSLSFILSSIFNQIFAPQWILLMPIGALILLGINKSRINT